MSSKLTIACRWPTLWSPRTHCLAALMNLSWNYHRTYLPLYVDNLRHSPFEFTTADVRAWYDLLEYDIWRKEFLSSYLVSLSSLNPKFDRVWIFLQVMRKHQRYFPVVDRLNGQLLPAFITVSTWLILLILLFFTNVSASNMILPLLILIVTTLPMGVVLLAGG